MADEPRKGGLLLPALIGAGSMALFTTAGIAPALYLAVGGLGGWLIGTKLKQGRPVAMPAPEGDESSSDEEEGDLEDELAEEEQGARMAAGFLNSFLRDLQGGAGSGERDAIEAGIHEAFSKVPPERLHRLFALLAPRAEVAPPSMEEMQEVRRIVEEVQSHMSPEAAAAMQRATSQFVPTPESTLDMASRLNAAAAGNR
eukprot:CAMPEP_0183436638 /NCGR_PEP_ID=MMETSP0370-20130417/69540_1 /TAXON_ID=268820 /ORGANISM="Peridinium aciculiferum, Strain PAER-2" /LENGTH=199 /DNA_ID=CAMNT_0025624133 /DNA_START=58 /DNA_END=657 /DNA_ORIENTATION=+